MKQYRPHIKASIKELEIKSKGRTMLGDRLSITHGESKFMVCIIDKGGIKEGWTMKWYPYTKKSVERLNLIISRQ